MKATSRLRGVHSPARRWQTGESCQAAVLLASVASARQPHQPTALSPLDTARLTTTCTHGSFWWGASLGVHVGHSETIERAGVSDDAQPLWWAKGGELIGRSPSRIKWFRSLWEGSETRPAFGNLVPTQSYLNDASKSSIVANLLSASNGSYIFAHFLRSGRWTVPLWSSVGRDDDANWEVRLMDYWGMKVSVLATLTGNASSATIDVPAVPANYELVRVAA